ncbi:MAG: hypothetical protein MUE50_06670 [Pirellulaceae bacterium]|jgi:hypothetical protein|nr:hypothetical protein [Pirellulaceae bacterium]
MPTTAQVSFSTFQIPAPANCSGSWYRTQMLAYTGQKFDLPLHSWMTDGAAPVPIGTPASTNLGIVGGTWGSAGHAIRTKDEKNNGGATSSYAVNTYMLPENYKGDGVLQIEVRAGMNTTVASATAVVDVEAYKLDADGTPTGSDLVTTDAQSINSLTLATKTFTIDGTGLVAGDKLMIRLTMTINDTATGTAVKGEVKRTTMLVETQG